MQVRTELGLTQKAAAGLVRVSRQMWIRYESGRSPMPPAVWELFLIKGGVKRIRSDRDVDWDAVLKRYSPARKVKFSQLMEIIMNDKLPGVVSLIDAYRVIASLLIKNPGFHELQRAVNKSKEGVDAMTKYIMRELAEQYPAKVDTELFRKDFIAATGEIMEDDDDGYYNPDVYDFGNASAKPDYSKGAAE
jgi:transcriptional regulator with XRE-family HTH domain